MGFFKRVLINAVIFVALAGLMPSILTVQSLWMALIASFVLSILNALIKPFLVIISFPITLLTFGLFSIVINGFILQLTSSLVGQGFHFASFGSAMVTAIVLSIVNMVISDYINA